VSFVAASLLLLFVAFTTVIFDGFGFGFLL
jgi:hypothetical protein